MSPRVGPVFGVAATASVWLWPAALVGVWASRVDARRPAVWLASAAALAALALGLTLPVQFFRAMLRLFDRPHAPRSAQPAAQAGDAARPRPVRLLGAGLLVAAATGLVSTSLLLAAVGPAHRLASEFLLDEPVGDVLVCLLQWAALTPWGIGAGVVWHAHRLTRQGRSSAAGRAQEDWLWGLAIAAGAAAMLRRAAWPFFPIALLAGAAQVLLGWYLLRRRGGEADEAPAAALAPASAKPALTVRLSVLACAATITTIGTAQLRAVETVLGATPGEQALLLGLCAAFVAVIWRGRPGPAVSAGHMAWAGVTASAALAIQAVLVWTALAGGPAAHWAWLACAAAQGPLLAALTALIISLGRRFAAGGGTSRLWMQWNLWGMALALAPAALAGVHPAAQMAAISALFVGLAATLIAGAPRLAGGSGRWMAGGAVLVAAVGVGLIAAAHSARQAGPDRLAIGRWLTGWADGSQAGYLPCRPESNGLAGNAGATAPDLLDSVVRQLAVQRAGPDSFSARLVAGTAPPRPLWPRWLVVSRRPLPAEVEAQVRVTYAVADLAVAALGPWHGRRVLDWRRALHAGPFRYHVVVYAPVAADHPASRVFCGAEALRAAAARVADGGLLVLVLDSAGQDAARLAGLARSAREALGPASMLQWKNESGTQQVILMAMPAGAALPAEIELLSQP